MPKRLGEINAEDLEEIEDGEILRNCLNCRKPHTRIMRIGTRTLFGACTNPSCFHYVNLRTLQNWVREELADLPPANTYQARGIPEPVVKSEERSGN